MKPAKLLYTLLLFFCFETVPASEAIWYPLHGNPTDSSNPLVSVGQVGSEVVLITAGPGFIFDYSKNLPSTKVPVEFPTLFVGNCIYSMRFSTEIEEGSYHEIYDPVTAQVNGKYNYDIGDGWIFHRKGLTGWTEPRTGKSLGWMYIQDYPWVYGLDWGWRYVVEAGIAWNANAWWFYEDDIGWFWTTRNLYPRVYHPGYGWLDYEENEA